MAEAPPYPGHNGEFYLLRQGLFIALGFGVGVAAFQVPMRVWQQAAPYLFLAGLLLLVVVLIPGIGREVNGSRRWIPLGLAHPQPAGAVKVGGGADDRVCATDLYLGIPDAAHPRLHGSVRRPLRQRLSVVARADRLRA